MVKGKGQRAEGKGRGAGPSRGASGKPAGSQGMTARVLEAINRQIAAEFAASLSYLAMAAWCEHHQFTGAGRWLRLQSAEEHLHAMRLFDFLLARHHPVRLSAIAEPHAAFGSIVEVFERAMAQEQDVSRQIDALYELAFSEKVFAAMAELQWFITEQVEEEKTIREIVAKFHMVEDDPASLLDLDRELGARPPGPPAAPAA
jgi:ferritin